jgi:hypothetical protein
MVHKTQTKLRSGCYIHKDQFGQGARLSCKTITDLHLHYFQTGLAYSNPFVSCETLEFPTKTLLIFSKDSIVKLGFFLDIFHICTYCTYLQPTLDIPKWEVSYIDVRCLFVDNKIQTCFNTSL